MSAQSVGPSGIVSCNMICVSVGCLTLTKITTCNTNQSCCFEPKLKFAFFVTELRDSESGSFPSHMPAGRARDLVMCVCVSLVKYSQAYHFTYTANNCVSYSLLSDNNCLLRCGLRFSFYRQLTCKTRSRQEGRFRSKSHKPCKTLSNPLEFSESCRRNVVNRSPKSFFTRAITLPWTWKLRHSTLPVFLAISDLKYLRLQSDRLSPLPSCVFITHLCGSHFENKKEFNGASWFCCWPRESSIINCSQLSLCVG